MIITKFAKEVNTHAFAFFCFETKIFKILSYYASASFLINQVFKNNLDSQIFWPDN